MDWLVVILVVTALAMIGVISLIHRGRVRIWSICMILLGLGIGILLYTQISLFKSWQTILSIVFSIVLALVLLYLFIVLGVRKQQKSTKADKNPEEGDVLATASREPMRLSDWEAVIAYSAAPAKASKEIRRVNAEKTPKVPMEASFSSAVFTSSTKADVNLEDEAMAADAITSFFRESTQMPASAIRMDAVKRSVTVNEKVEERKPYPEPLRVSPSAKPIVEPAADKEDEAFESLSFRVVRDKSAQGVSAVSQNNQESAFNSPLAPKSSVTKDAHAAEQETAPSPVYKVHKPAAAVPSEEETPIALEIAIEQEELAPSVLLKSDADVPEQAQLPEDAAILVETPEQPAAKLETYMPAFAEELVAPVMEAPQELATQEVIVSEEPLPTIMAEEPEEYSALSPTAAEWEVEPVPAVQEAQPAVDEDEPLEEAEPEVQVEEADPIGNAELVSESEPVSTKLELPALEESEPLVPEQKNAETEFGAGMAMLNTLIASKEYRNAQTLIFDLLRMEYEPTEEEKRRLLLVMKLLKEKETKANADARSR